MSLRENGMVALMKNHKWYQSPWMVYARQLLVIPLLAELRLRSASVIDSPQHDTGSILNQLQRLFQDRDLQDGA